MPKLPVVSGKETIKAFEKLGYVATRQKGSHVRMHHPDLIIHKPLSIPLHKTLGRGLLRRLTRDANISVEQFRDLL